MILEQTTLRERQLRLYGHGPAEDPAHRILSCRDPSEWTMPRGRPQASWLRQVESYLKDVGMTGLAFYWAMTRRRPIWRIWAWRTWRLPGRWPDGGLSEGYGHGGPGVCLGDGQTEAEGVPSQGGRGDALLRRMSPYLTWYFSFQNATVKRADAQTIISEIKKKWWGSLW